MVAHFELMNEECEQEIAWSSVPLVGKPDAVLR
jgi:hypothetical protein